MPPRRRSPSSTNPLDLVLQLLAALFANGGGGAKAATAALAVAVGLAVVGTFGWYLFQPAQRKAEIGQLVGNYSRQHKQIKVTEVLWDIWTRYFNRSFVPAQVGNGDTILLAGEPQPAGFRHAIRTLHNTAYTVGYCDDLADPAWVAYRVFDLPGHPHPPKRPGGFETDGRTSARVETGDFVGSGYDRGHMAPNYAIGTRFGAAAQEETFLLSNVCPQRHRLNAGLWKDLEARVAENYTGRFGQVWVIDGPVFGPEDRLQRLRGKPSVPLAFYMIILQRHEGGVRAQGFVMDQETPARGTLDDYLVSIGDIEQRTGLQFFPDLDRNARQQLEGQKPTSSW